MKITGRWWKIKKVYVDWNWGNWTFGFWFSVSWIRKCGFSIGPLMIDFDLERILE